MINGKKYSKYDFKDILRARRKDCGYRSCSKLAEAMMSPIDKSGDSEQAGILYIKAIDTMRKKIERWETGKGEPSTSEFKQLCEILECDPEYLWGICPTPRRETRQVMDITGLEQPFINYVLAKRNDKDCLQELNKLLCCDELENLLNLLEGLSYSSTTLEEEIVKAREKAHKYLEPYPVTEDEYMGERFRLSTDDLTAVYADFRRMRFEISDYFSSMVDSIYGTQQINSSIAEIELLYRPYRRSKIVHDE